MNLHVHVESMKVILENCLTLSRDSLHIHVGLIIFFALVVLGRQPLRSPWPWTAAFVAAVLGEVIDLTRYFPYVGYDQINASVHDLLNTMFWPTVLLLLGRFTHVMQRQPPSATNFK